MAERIMGSAKKAGLKETFVEAIDQQHQLEETRREPYRPPRAVWPPTTMPQGHIDAAQKALQELILADRDLRGASAAGASGSSKDNYQCKQNKDGEQKSKSNRGNGRATSAAPSMVQAASVASIVWGRQASRCATDHQSSEMKTGLKTRRSFHFRRRRGTDQAQQA